MYSNITLSIGLHVGLICEAIKKIAIFVFDDYMNLIVLIYFFISFNTFQFW